MSFELVRPKTHHPPHTPSAVSSSPPSVDVYHPAAPQSLLFTLCAYDSAPTGKWGVYYDLVLEACSIKANNKPGHISTTRGAEGRVSATTRVLEAGDYYYIVEDTCTPYPVVPSFDAWTFPSTIPARWFDAFPANIPKPPVGTPTAYGTPAMADDVMRRDKVCLLTEYDTGTQSCHLVPRMYINWYKEFQMWRYTRHILLSVLAAVSRIINVPGNGITLRKDIGMVFDSGDFAFVVKDGALVCHFLRPNVQLAELYHNVAITPPGDVPSEIMYARFAWAVIEQAGSAALGGLPLVSPVPGAARVDPTQSAETDEDGVPTEEEEASSPLSLSALAAAFREESPHLREEADYSADGSWQTLDEDVEEPGE